MKKKINQLNLDLLKAPLIGVDEVGRGCIAGPVCAAAVIFNEKKITAADLETYIDSKKIPEAKRDLISLQIQTDHYFSVGWATAAEIDEINIRQATLLAMSRAVEELQNKIDITKGTLLIDGRDTLPALQAKFGTLDQRALISGDVYVRQISAASIVAKVCRDQWMRKLSLNHPQYGFEKHKGYGTEVHREAVKKYGVLEIHRRSFGGVKEFLT